MNRKYVAVLALAAAAILIGGSLVRPARHGKAAAAPPPVATAAPSHRSQMRQISDFLADRAAGAATHIVLLPDSGASGVVWPDGTVVTAPRSSGLVEARIESGLAAPPVLLAPSDRFSQAGWVVAVARSTDGKPVSVSGLLGGVADVRCGAESLRKLVFNTPLDATFAGAGVFDLSGDLLGVVARCNNDWTALTWQSVQGLLKKQQGPEEELWRSLGVRLREAGEPVRALMNLPRSGGLLVGEVRRASRAFQIGLRPGDLLTRVDNAAVTAAADVAAKAEDLTVVRGGKPITLDAHPPFALEPAAAGPVLTSVEPGTRLHDAGLRAGDRIVRANGIEDPGPTDLNRLFASGKPAWLVYERENRRVWTMLP